MKRTNELLSEIREIKNKQSALYCDLENEIAHFRTELGTIDALRVQYEEENSENKELYSDRVILGKLFKRIKKLADSRY